MWNCPNLTLREFREVGFLVGRAGVLNFGNPGCHFLPSGLATHARAQPARPSSACPSSRESSAPGPRRRRRPHRVGGLQPHRVGDGHARDSERHFLSVPNRNWVWTIHRHASVNQAYLTHGGPAQNIRQRWRITTSTTRSSIDMMLPTTNAHPDTLAHATSTHGRAIGKLQHAGVVKKLCKSIKFENCHVLHSYLATL